MCDLKMSSSPFHFDTIIDDSNAENDLRNLLPQLRPNWKDEDVKFKTSPRTMDAGLLNLMITCYITPDFKDAIMFRINRNEELDLYNHLSRDKEVENIKLLRKLYGFVPNVIAIYKNGFCYEYIQGQVMNKTTIREPEANWRLIAKQIGLVHATKHDFIEDKTICKFGQYFANLVDSYPDSLKDPEENERFQKEMPTREVLQREIKLVADQMKDTENDIVFSHNDPRPENMVWNQDTGAITFVDWETAGWNRRTYDITYHFMNYSGLDNPDFSLKPNKDFQLKWLRVYLDSYYSVVDPVHLVRDDDIEKLYIQVKKYDLHFLLQTVSWIASQDDFADFPFNILDITTMSYNEYLKIKEETLAL